MYFYWKTSVSEVGRAAVAADKAVKESIATYEDANISVREEATVDKHALISVIVLSWEVALFENKIVKICIIYRILLNIFYGIVSSRCYKELAEDAIKVAMAFTQGEFRLKGRFAEWFFWYC